MKKAFVFILLVLLIILYSCDSTYNYYRDSDSSVSSSSSQSSESTEDKDSEGDKNSEGSSDSSDSDQDSNSEDNESEPESKGTTDSSNDSNKSSEENGDEIINETSSDIVAKYGFRNYSPEILYSVGGVTKYTVQKGDTVYSIARKFNVSPADIIKLNNLSKPDNIKPGMVLKIPGGGLKIFSPVKSFMKSYKTDNILILEKCDNLVYSPFESGIVTHVGYIRGYGLSVMIKNSEYAIIISGFKDVSVKAGYEINFKKLIGTIDNGQHLYISLFKNKTMVNLKKS